jgi:hypothetical protein
VAYTVFGDPVIGGDPSPITVITGTLAHQDGKSLLR